MRRGKHRGIKRRTTEALHAKPYSGLTNSHRVDSETALSQKKFRFRVAIRGNKMYNYVYSIAKRNHPCSPAHYIIIVTTVVKKKTTFPPHFPMPTSSKILDRIIKLKNLKNDAGLARFFNIKPAIISNWRTRGTIPYDIIVSFCEQHNTPLDYIISGRGPHYASAPSFHGTAETPPFQDRVAETVKYRPEYGVDNDEFVYISQVMGRISAGRGRIPENNVDVKVAFRKEWVNRKGNPKNMVLIKVDGDSMEPSLLSGDVVLIDRNRNYIDPQGGIYALALDDIIMIKRVQVLADKIRIISDNPKYEAFDVPTDRVKVNGKVIWFARELER